MSYWVSFIGTHGVLEISDVCYRYPLGLGNVAIRVVKVGSTEVSRYQMFGVFSDRNILKYQFNTLIISALMVVYVDIFL